MNHLHKFILSILLVAILSIPFAGAQTGAGATAHFEQDGLSFDYPVAWTVKDGSSPGMQKFTITPHDAAAQIVVSAERKLGRSCDFALESRNILGELVKTTAAQIDAVMPVTTSPVRAQVGALTAEGAKLQGDVNGKPVTAELYSLRLDKHFVNLIYIRNNEDRRSLQAWETIRTSLRLSQGVMTYGAASIDESSGASTSESDSLSVSFLNGRALALPKPAYPAIARSAHASGTVAVQVMIDETGNVIAAHAVSGHPLLMAVSLAAAKEAKFTPPKFCGEPLRVTGVITYNFVAQ